MTDYRVFIARWRPARLNELLGPWRPAAKKKKLDRQMIAAHRCRFSPAQGKRRVSLHIILGPRQQKTDVDAYWKSLLDGLTLAGLLIDDNDEGVQLGTVTYERGDKTNWGTWIVLEDLDA